jgi:hypothetical protein
MKTHQSKHIFHGIHVMIWGGITDKRGREMYYATIDGDTIAKGYSVEYVKRLARIRCQ